MQDIIYKKAVEKAANLCSKSEKCVSQIRKKLRDWGLDETQAQKAIDYLLDEKFIDEERFTKYYVRDKFRFNHWGRIKISYSLRQLQINSSHIDDALEQIELQDYQETLLTLLQAKRRSIKSDDNYDIRMKLARFAQGRGFEPDISFKTIDTILQNESY